MITLALLLASAAANQSGASAEYQAAYDKAFRSSFRNRAIEQCRTSAPNAAAAKIDITPICVCVADRLLAAKSVEELKVQPAAVELQTLTTECIVANPPVSIAKKP